MKLTFLLIIFCASQIFGTETSSKEYYYPDDDGGEFMIKMMFTRLNEILLENRNISKNVLHMNKRLENQTKLFQNIAELNEDIESIKNTLNQAISAKPLNVYQTRTVIQRRQDGSVDFNRNWTDYKNGFGNPDGEFFLDLDKLHEITTFEGPQELLIKMKDFAGEIRYAKYDNFVIGSEQEKYVLKELGHYEGDAGDSLWRHRGAKFSTKGQDNGVNKFTNCASLYKGGWWFHDGCYSCYLNGQYFQSSASKIGGINWNSWHGINYSLKFVEMSIRPKLNK